MPFYYQILLTNSECNVKYIARIPLDKSESYPAALRAVRYANICYEEHLDTDYSLLVRKERVYLPCLYNKVSNTDCVRCEVL